MPDDKIVQDGYLLTEEPEPKWGLARSIPVQGGIWGARLNQTRVGKWGGAQTPVRCLPFPLVGPESDFRVECVWQTPVIQLLFNFVFKQSYQNRTSDGCAALSDALKSIPEVIRRNSLSSGAYLRQHRCCVRYKTRQESPQTNGGKQNKMFLLS